MRKCKVDGCLRKNRAGGFCETHYRRNKHGVPLDKPIGMRGELNPNWKGGKSLYTNGYEYRKMRLGVLKESGYKCRICGGYTDEVHHIDLTKTNHEKINLMACCHACNQKVFHRGPHNSKFRKLYGMTLKEMANKLNIQIPKVRRHHLSGKLLDLIKE